MSTSMRSYLDFVKACDSYPYKEDTSQFYKLLLPHDDRPHGYMLPDIVRKMPWTDRFTISHDSPRFVQVKDTSDGTKPSQACNDAIEEVVSQAIDQGTFQIIKLQHREKFSILGSNYQVMIERSAMPLFGCISRGAHLTVYTRTATGLKVWVPRRSDFLHTYPNKLDTTVAGGIRGTDTPFETILHEAEEEASLPNDLLRSKAHSVGTLTYIGESGCGAGGETGLIAPDIVYLYDMEVDEHVVPRPNDEEVNEFYLWTVDEIKKALFNDEFKPNCAVVMIDFFIRHGIITSENERDYVEIIMRMHRQLPFATHPTSD